jgi:hypothetical protein
MFRASASRGAWPGLDHYRQPSHAWHPALPRRLGADVLIASHVSAYRTARQDLIDSAPTDEKVNRLV